jgi:hypothetical protein
VRSLIKYEASRAEFKQRCTLSVPALITTDLRLWLHTGHTSFHAWGKFADLPTCRPHIHAAIFSWALLWRAHWGRMPNALSHICRNSATKHRQPLRLRIILRKRGSRTCRIGRGGEARMDAERFAFTKCTVP